MELINQLKNAPEHILNAAQIIPIASTPVRICAFVVLFLLGAASGFFSVPLLAFIQARPPARDKGKVFAAVNWLNWIFIVAAAVAYGAGIVWVDNRRQPTARMVGIADLDRGVIHPARDIQTDSQRTTQLRIQQNRQSPTLNRLNGQQNN